jgi:hypothetical protein
MYGTRDTCGSCQMMTITHGLGPGYRFLLSDEFPRFLDHSEEEGSHTLRGSGRHCGLRPVGAANNFHARNPVTFSSRESEYVKLPS